MAVLWVRPDWKENGGDWSGPLDRNPTLAWIIEVDDKTMSYEQVYVASLPFLPAQFEGFPGAAGFPIPTARQFRLRRFPDSQYHWRCTVTYSTAPLTQEEKEKESNDSPLNRAPRISVDRENLDKVIFEDRSGEGILTSAGDVFEDPIVWPGARKVYNITYNAQTIPVWHDDLEGKINAAAKTISKGGSPKEYPAGTLLYMPGAISDLKEEAGISYMEISFQLLVDRRTWKLRLLDQGYNYLDGGTKKVIEIDGQRPSDPQLLDGAGGLLANPSPATAEYLDFDVAEEGDFAPLPTDDTP
jgi:hypothetical protein